MSHSLLLIILREAEPYHSPVTIDITQLSVISRIRTKYTYTTVRSHAAIRAQGIGAWERSAHSRAKYSGLDSNCETQKIESETAID